jgi:phosphocarrier protein
MGVLQKKQDGGEATQTREFTIENKLGLHARPAAMFVRVANQVPCEINVEKDNEQVNGKSIMGLMMLAAGCGSQLKVIASGDQAAEALEAIAALIKRKFDEE